MAGQETPRISYLSGGKLHVLAEGGAPKVFESRFGQEIRDRAAQLQRKHEWKTKGRGAQFTARGSAWST